MVFVPAIAQAGLVQLLSPRSAAAQTAIGVVTYTYDDNGNLKTRSHLGNTDTYTWDFENRLVAADVEIGPNPGLVTYAYNADGARISKTVGGVTTTYLVDENRDLAEVLVETTAGVATRYTYGHTMLHLARPGVTRFYHRDGQHSTRQLTDAAGTVTDGYTFDAFGELLAASGTTPNLYQYGGQQLDPNLGFYYLRARYYAQALGRFIGPDPAEGVLFDPPSLHRYLYAHSDPVNRHDPSGRADFNLASVVTGLFIVGILLDIASFVATLMGHEKLGGILGAISLVLAIVSLRVDKLAAKATQEGLKQAAKKKLQQEAAEELAQQLEQRALAQVSAQGIRGELEKRIIDFVGDHLRRNGGAVAKEIGEEVRDWILTAGPNTRTIFVETCKAVFKKTNIKAAREILDEMIHVASKIKGT
jgi:RHS repeat-associated protein